LNPARASIFMGHGPGVCLYSYSTVHTYSFPAVTIPIPKSAAVGDPIGGWQTNGSSSLGWVVNGFDTFLICAPWQVMRSTGTTNGTEDYLWVTGTKPADVYASTDVSSVVVDGNSYTVWTTDALSGVGLGFILRWRAQASGAGVGKGEWRYPTSGWSVDVPPSSDGFPFYQSTNIEHWRGNCDPRWYPNFSSLGDFRYSLRRCPSLSGAGIPFYGAQVEVRYVLTKPASSLQSELDVNTHTITTDFVILKGRQASHSFTGQATIRQMIHFRLPPTGTCQSPSVEEGTVHFGAAYTTDFPNNQWGAASGADRDFTLTFRNCPRMNLRYYVHANGNKWVDSARGVVGVQGSNPGAANPIAGNPSGFAIQLQHRSDSRNQAQSGMNVYIHPNQVAQPLALPTTGNNRQAYTRTSTGSGTFDDPALGVTHTIPLRARLVRTAHSSQQQIETGPFNASIIVAIAYP